MDKNDKLEALKFLSETHRDQFNKRRIYEWRLLYATALFFALSIYTMLKNLEVEYNCLCMIPYIIMAVSVFIFFVCSSKANNINKEYAEKAERLIAELAGEANFFPKQSKHPLSIWGGICLLSFVLSILFLLYYVMLKL